MASLIGLKILIPKHPWKSLIRPLQPILAAKRYVSFFLGHPVYRVCTHEYIHSEIHFCILVHASFSLILCTCEDHLAMVTTRVLKITHLQLRSQIVHPQYSKLITLAMVATAGFISKIAHASVVTPCL